MKKQRKFSKKDEERISKEFAMLCEEVALFRRLERLCKHSKKFDKKQKS